VLVQTTLVETILPPVLALRRLLPPKQAQAQRPRPVVHQVPDILPAPVIPQVPAIHPALDTLQAVPVVQVPATREAPPPTPILTPIAILLVTHTPTPTALTAILVPRATHTHTRAATPALSLIPTLARTRPPRTPLPLIRLHHPLLLLVHTLVAIQALQLERTPLDLPERIQLVPLAHIQLVPLAHIQLVPLAHTPVALQVRTQPDTQVAATQVEATQVEVTQVGAIQADIRLAATLDILGSLLEATAVDSPLVASPRVASPLMLLSVLCPQSSIRPHSRTWRMFM